MNIRYKKMNRLSFLTPTVATVLEFFLDDPMKEHYVREVVKKAGVSLGSANKILKMLTDRDLLTRESKGRMVIHKLNLKAPAVRQFKILVNILALNDLIVKMKQYSTKIVLFGSCSQGTDVKESDIDLLTIANEKDPVKKAISEFNQRSDRKIALITVSMNEYVLLKKNDKPLYENIERGIILWKAE